MPGVEQEGQLQFDFSGALAVRRVDRQQPGVPQPRRMKLVDFCVEEATRALLVEIKDPSDTNAKPENRAKFVRRMESDVLLKTLLLKARDTYTFLHLMRKDGKPFTYVVAIGTDNVPIDAALVLDLQQRLRAKLRQETDQPWPRQYVSDCVVLTSEAWARHMRYSVQRSP